MDRLIDRFFVLALSLFCVPTIFAQSTNIDFPTPVANDTIIAQIPARDVGDARLTAHFYTFNAANGDVFLTITTSNLNGDFDLFVGDNMRPLLKASVFASSVPTQMERQVYLRKNEKLILRVEGRSPNDDPGTYKITFSGAFEPIAGVGADAPKVTGGGEPESGVIVNSVGTVVRVIPPKPKETPLPKVDEPKVDEKAVAKAQPKPGPSPRTRRARNPAPPALPEGPKVIITDVPKQEEPEAPKAQEVVVTDLPRPERRPADAPKPVKPTPKAPRQKVLKPPKTTDAAEARPPESSQASAVAQPVLKDEPAAKKPKSAKASLPSPDPLASVQLVVIFKDGRRIERPMSEVSRVSVDKGILTIVFKDAKIERHSIVDVQEMKITGQ